MQETLNPYIMVFNPLKPFVTPYLLTDTDIAVFNKLPDVLPGGLVSAVMISDSEIYREDDDVVYIDEDSAVDPDSPYAVAEAAFARFCDDNGLKPTVLRCANPVGTGMDGLPMRLVRGIARGTLMHVRGCEGAVSVMHVRDLPRLVKLSADSGLTFNVTDGTETSVDALIDALAVRVSDKHVFTVGKKLGKLIYSRSCRAMLSQRRLYNDSRLQRLLADAGAAPMTCVTDYLTNHTYTDEDL